MQGGEVEDTILGLAFREQLKLALLSSWSLFVVVIPVGDSHCVARGGLELLISLPLPPQG